MNRIKVGKTVPVASALLASTLSFAAGTTTTTASPSAPDMRPVTQEQFNQLLRIFKRTIDRVDDLEKRPAGASGKKDDSVDLSNLDSKPAAPTNMGPHGAVTQGAPNFKVYFDLNLVNRPGLNNFTFQNYHSLLMFEILPSSELQFTFDINPSPRYYELDYQISPKVQLRAGKIWIPFDDLNPHNIFGGRINTSKLATGATAFLPDLWTELGLGFKFQLIETKALNVEAHAYVVNGFGTGGSDPMGTSSPYPTFSESSISSTDNNRNKAIGARAHALFGNMFGIGASYYRGQWSDDSADPSVAGQNLGILGVDGQIHLSRTGTEIRAGLASMSVDLWDSSFTRGGVYAEFGQKFGKSQRWKLLVRGGEIQLDNRVIAVSDQMLVGATILYNPGMIQYSIEHSRDLKDVPGKVNTQYTALRLIVAL